MRHPQEIFRYCPRCGSQHFIVASPKSKRCGNCSFEWFLNPSSACVAIVIDNGKLLTVKRRLPPAAGTLDLPGGFADIGETAEESVTRELYEETGLRVSQLHYLFSLPNMYNYSGFDIPTQDLFFRCHTASPTIAIAHDDAAECLWIPLPQLQPEQFGLHSISEGIRCLLAHPEWW